MSRYKHHFTTANEYAFIAGSFLRDLATCVPVTIKDLIKENKLTKKPDPNNI